MNNKQIGLVIAILGVALLILTFSFTNKILADNKVLHTSCTLPAEVCPFNSYPAQGVFGFVISGLMISFGAFLIFAKQPKTITTSSKKTDIQASLKELKGDEKNVLEIVADEGTIFQSDLVEKSNLNKVKITRILDTLEGKSLIERKRRGMSNVIILK